MELTMTDVRPTPDGDGAVCYEANLSSVDELYEVRMELSPTLEAGNDRD